VSAPAGVALSGVRFSYGRDPLIDDLDFRFPPGEMSAITGPSGCGKSTLLYLIGLMLTPDSGGVEFDGSPVSGLDDAERSWIRAKTVGFVFQDAALNPTRTVLDNITAGVLFAGVDPRSVRNKARRLMGEMGVALDPDRLPGQVSGGQAQRIALCRALIKRPRVIVADEPTGNLDTDSASVVLNALADEAATGATVVIATHDGNVVDACPTVLPLA
jgi:lipoprotein-releasing system ATP-binding protein